MCDYSGGCDNLLHHYFRCEECSYCVQEFKLKRQVSHLCCKCTMLKTCTRFKVSVRNKKNLPNAPIHGTSPPALTAGCPPGRAAPPDLLLHGGQREFNARVPHSSKVIIAVALCRGLSGSG